MDSKLVKFIREQFPPGTRVRLDSMNDPYAPVAPGTEGEVALVDDAGQIHMNWADGRTLPLIPGEDHFTVLAPKLSLLKLYAPLTADYYLSHDGNESVGMDGQALLEYQDQIAAALLKNRAPEEAERGVMHWYGKADGVRDKVRSAVFTVEERDGQLWGVVECRVAGKLTTEELRTLKDYLAGQMSDGWGESFEQREIRVDRRSALYVHLWNYGDWSIQTEQERFSPKFADGLPELCFSTLPSSGELICIKRGERGYYPSDWNTPDREQNRQIAEEQNRRLGVTLAQREAMECGSMHGWTVPGADPAFVEEMQKKQEQKEGMTIAQSM